MNKRFAGLLVAGLMAVALLTGCGGGSKASTGTSAASSEVVVKLKSTQFSPKQIEIKAGQTIKWVNEDEVDHSIFEGVPDNGHPAFHSEEFGKGKSYTHTFDKPGTYDIHCNSGGHGLIGMTMKVVVK